MKLTDKEIAYLKANFGKLSSGEMARQLGRDKSTIKSYFYRNGMKVNAIQLRNIRVACASSKTTTTPEIDKYITEQYLLQNVKQLARSIGRSATFIKTRLKRLNLNVPKELREARKRKFVKGSVPANKGKKLHEFMSQEGIAKSSATRFKKGNLPANLKEIGYERINIDGYVEIRVKESYQRNNFILKHRHIYQEHFGVKLKTTDIIVFKDGNRLNFDINNLEKTTKNELLRRNSIHRYPEEIKEIIRLKGKLKRTIEKTT